MIDTVKSSRWIRDPLVQRRPSYTMPSGQEIFAPRLMTGDAEGYSDVRRNRSRVAALDCRDFPRAAGDLQDPEPRRELLNRATVCPRFFLSRLHATALVKIEAIVERSAWQDS
jgi:hypothetical protein